MQKICLLGLSGSIGMQTIDVMKKNSADFDLVGFSIGKQTRKIAPIIKHYSNVKGIYIIDLKVAQKYQKRYPNIKFFSGEDGLIELIDFVQPTMVVNALVGFVGLRPTIHALQNNLIVCLANKETLVVGGELVNHELSIGHGKLYPIDSEHVAIAKCLSVDNKNVNQIVLTASGGAFRKLSREQLVDVTPEDALNHPTWKMGHKITIDCATMINKAFEVIEAHYLFNYPREKIGIKLHDESYIHSYIEYKDGLLRLDEGKPDMRKPIKYALYEGLTSFKTVTAYSLDSFKKYHFHDFDIKRYPIVALADKVINDKGGYGAVFNASNEIAVYAFLAHKIPFLAIEEIVNKCMNEYKNKKHPTLEEIVELDKKTRQKATLLVESWGK